MKKFVVLEGIDACGKTFLRERIQNLSRNDIVSVNRNTNVNMSGKDLSTFDFSKNWFKDRTIDISPTIKTYVSIIQIRYLYENIVLPSISLGKTVVADSWWGKSLVNIQYQNLHFDKLVFNDVLTFYDMLGKDVLDAMRTYYIRFDNPEDAYKIYIKKNSPETILGKNEFDKSFYLEYVVGFQKIMDVLAQKYKFSIINMKFIEGDIEPFFDQIARDILLDIN